MFALEAGWVEFFLDGVLAGEPKRRGLKKGIFATLGYFVAHESHHRGNILLTLKECGHNIDKAARRTVRHLGLGPDVELATLSSVREES